MATNLSIDPRLIERALILSGERTKQIIQRLQRCRCSSPTGMIISTRRISALVFVGITACLTLSCAAPDRRSAIEIQTEDVTRFYDIYERTDGQTTAAQIQRFYVEPGSAGLRHLTQARNVNAETIARALAERPELYTNARACLAALPRIRDRLRQSFANLLRRYPEASRPPITILISHGKPVAIAGPTSGVQVALEAVCSETAARFLGANIEDRLVHLIAHEYIHVQQPEELPDPTVLQRALEEGIADFLGELISGGIPNVAVHESVRGREMLIEQRFAAHLDQRDLSAWFDNTTMEDVGQLGYWVGYRIAKAYYANAPDQQAAIGEMIKMTDAHAFLAKSGWRPGIELN